MRRLIILQYIWEGAEKFQLPTQTTCYSYAIAQRRRFSLGQIILYVPLQLSMEQDRKKRTQPTMASSVTLLCAHRLCALFSRALSLK